MSVEQHYQDRIRSALAEDDIAKAECLRTCLDMHKRRKQLREDREDRLKTPSHLDSYGDERWLRGRD